MVADSDVQVWLDTSERTQPAMVTPYVQSDYAQALRYRVRVENKGLGGRSVIGQSGTVNVQPDTPAALSRFSMSRHAGHQCVIQILLTGTDGHERLYRFECPPP